MFLLYKMPQLPACACQSSLWSAKSLFFGNCLALTRERKRKRKKDKNIEREI